MRSQWSAITLYVDAMVVVRAHDASCGNVDRMDYAELRRRMGVVAYLGVPIELGGVTVGMLCTHDARPHQFDLDLLVRLARFASERLVALTRAPGSRSRQLFEIASRPALAELRNAVTPIEADLTITRELLQELSAEQQRTWHSIAASRQALASTVRRFRDSVAAVDEQVRALRLLSEQRANMALGEIVEASSVLAHHHTALIGGVRWSVSRAERAISVPARTSVAVVSSALSLIAQALHLAHNAAGIDAHIRHSENAVTFDLRSDLGPEAISECQRTIAALLEAEDVELQQGEHSLVLVMDAA